MKPLVYVAGPMSGLPDWNFPAFHDAAKVLRDLGYEVVNPAECEDNLNPDGTGKPWDVCLRNDIVNMLTEGCSELVMLDGWTASRGARLEHHIAKELGLKVRDYWDVVDDARPTAKRAG